MKFIAKVFLVISFILSFLVLLITITARFQLLDQNFWITSFRQGNVYEKLEKPLSDQIEKTFIEEGAGIRESKMIASVLAKDSLQELLENNTRNFLDFINNKKSVLTIYFPLNKLPVSIRENLEINSNEFTLDYLLNTFGKSSTPIGQDFFVQLRSLGNAITISLVVSIISLLITLWMIYKMEEPGNKLFVTSISLILSGVITIILILVLNNQVGNLSKELGTASQDPTQIVLATLLPPLFSNIVKIWLVISVITIILGGLALLVKKGGIPKLQKT